MAAPCPIGQSSTRTPGLKFRNTPGGKAADIVRGLHMHLVQLLLPVADNDGRLFPASLYEDVTSELTDRFGGVTAYTRSPAEGRWQSGTSEHHDDVLVVEVMVEKLDPTWWSKFRQKLAATFRQESLVIRAQAIQLL